ncbi:hypothetical protein [Olleya sp. YS]|uniref:hypothetical protein n=1 Tax=Olleya sp. YS TaxID=3028318 RepID=UPI0024344817|nr:hypothetical protein [Olleya sp. YS]WGD34027.1 hypothetical protein Ollyesu_09565 [Olleya sp. YS]
MKNIDIIIWTIFLSATFSVVFYIYYKKSKAKDIENYNSDVRKLIKAINNNHKEGIVIYGNNVLWNYYLKSDDLDYLIICLEKYIEESSELKKLYDSCIDKKIHRNTSHYRKYWVL